MQDALPNAIDRGVDSLTPAFIDGSTGRHWVPPRAPKSWAAQCALGRDLGAQAVAYIRRTGDAKLLHRVAIEMPGDPACGVETGFWSAVSSAAM